MTSDHIPALLLGFFSAYLLGSTNLTILAARLRGIEELRAEGSGNPGVTNLYRVAGGRIAATVLVAEILKAYVAVNLVSLTGAPPWSKPLMMLPYLVGNIFPLFHKFRGGKGIAAVVGSCLGVNPFVMLLGGGVFVPLFLVFRRVSVGSLGMVLSYPVWIVLLSESRLFLWVSLGIIVIVSLTHRQNIVRLSSGTEPRLRRERR